MIRQLFVALIAPFVFTVVLAGCQPAPVPDTAIAVEPSSTQVRATEPAPSATRPAPTPTFPPEVVASQPSDIAGVWRLQYRGAVATFPANLTLGADSTFSLVNADEGSTLISGIVRFAEGKTIFSSEACFDISIGTFACEMHLIIYASLEDGRPVRLRFEGAEETIDPREERFFDNFDGKALLPAPS
jgi:hypothetical protein